MCPQSLSSSTIHTLYRRSEFDAYFTFQPEDTRIVTPLNPEQYLRDLKQIRIVRVTLAPYMFTVTRMTIVRTFLALGEQSTTTQRPSFVLLQIGSEQKYGLFSIALSAHKKTS
jgi:hypothetical protein